MSVLCWARRLRPCWGRGEECGWLGFLVVARRRAVSVAIPLRVSCFRFHDIFTLRRGCHSLSPHLSKPLSFCESLSRFAGRGCVQLLGGASGGAVPLETTCRCLGLLLRCLTSSLLLHSSLFLHSYRLLPYFPHRCRSPRNSRHGLFERWTEGFVSSGRGARILGKSVRLRGACGVCGVAAGTGGCRGSLSLCLGRG